MKGANELSIEDPGLDSIEAQQRKQYMVDLFVTQAKNYDLHDDIYGFYAHRLWVLSLLRVVKSFMQGRSSARMLDLACGTGFITFNVAKRFDNIDIDGFDISPEMVAVARKRYQKSFKGRNIEFWVGDAELPCGEGRYDIVTTCFAFRNFANKSLAVENVFKALKPGGVFIIQDMTKPERQPLRAVYLFALKHLLPVLARILGTEKGAARDLYNAVQLMPRNAEIKALLEGKGFAAVSCKGRTMGMGCIVVGNKPGV